MENKNFLLAVVLSMGFLMVWTVFVVPRLTPPTAPQTAESSMPLNGSSSVPGTEMVAAHAPMLHPPVIEDVIIRNDRNEVFLAAQGGGIRHWRLKLKGQEIDLVNNPDLQPLPLSTFSDTVFAMQVNGVEARMQATLNNGVRLQKTLTLAPAGFLNELAFHFVNPGNTPVEVKAWEFGWGPGIGTSDTERKDNGRNTRAIRLDKLKVHNLKAGDYPGVDRWAGIDNRYFLVAFVPTTDPTATVVVSGVKDLTKMSVRQDVQIPAHGTLDLHYQFYAGPKGYTQLKQYGKDFQEAVDLGFFSFLGKAALQALYWLEGVTHNFGWSIVILTFALQLLMIPLTMKSFKATLGMKALQPKIAELQKLYKSDPKRLNIEMMNLYKKTGTNPFGGCLPMLLQLPIFWALYATLRNAYELRGAPFIFWIHDLAAPDPYHILPLVMGGAMFLQQRMAGAVSDPTQKQMMMMMPIMFTVMFFNFPAGLVLYWLTNNVLTMTVQWSFQRYSQSAAPSSITPEIISNT